MKVTGGTLVNGVDQPYPARMDVVCVNRATCPFTTIVPSPPLSIPVPGDLLTPSYQAYTEGKVQLPPGMNLSVGAVSPIVKFWGRRR